MRGDLHAGVVASCRAGVERAREVQHAHPPGRSAGEGDFEVALCVGDDVGRQVGVDGHAAVDGGGDGEAGADYRLAGAVEQSAVGDGLGVVGDGDRRVRPRRVSAGFDGAAYADGELGLVGAVGAVDGAAGAGGYGEVLRVADVGSCRVAGKDAQLVRAVGHRGGIELQRARQAQGAGDEPAIGRATGRVWDGDLARPSVRRPGCRLRRCHRRCP